MFGARTQGILFAVAAAVCYGLNPLGAKSLYAAGLTADSVLFYRYALAAALLGGLAKDRQIIYFYCHKSRAVG